MSTSADDSAVVVCVDGSPASDAAVRWAAREAVICNAPITLTHVIAPALTTTTVPDLGRRFESLRTASLTEIKIVRKAATT
jgi:nucleotide-binding universal stress UspA family protein